MYWMQRIREWHDLGLRDEHRKALTCSWRKGANVVYSLKNEKKSGGNSGNGIDFDRNDNL